MHFRDDEERQKGSPVLIIPPAIYERMLTYTFMLSAQLGGNGQDTTMVHACIREFDNEHFITFQDYRRQSVTPRYYIGFSQMKDI